MNISTLSTEFLVIGSGAAGLNAACEASRYGSVVLITKSSLETSSSYWAQGGIAAVLSSGDSFDSHKKDTLSAGRGLCDEKAADILIEEGACGVQELIDRGMAFDRTDGDLELGLEGGHSHRRVLHANGATTGKALIHFFKEQVKNRPNITIIENSFVFELAVEESRCVGAKAYQHDQDRLLTVQSPVTILATGGYSGLYQRSTNPHTSTGDGLWLGYTAGADLQDLEFVQFHPTAFYAEDGSTFLISEAVRGEGARLVNEQGERFMSGYPQQELSPRDIVAREIFSQIQYSKASCVYLDVSHLNLQNLRRHFPSLTQKIESQGINIAEEGIPVAPAAHYCIGGISSDLKGQTTVEGLYVCGEAAATGVHGANRLASNSLLECLVFSTRAVKFAADQSYEPVQYSNSLHGFHVDGTAEARFIALHNEISEMLSLRVGIERHAQEMTTVLEDIQYLEQSLSGGKEYEYYTMRSKGMLQLAEGITRSALERKESRGVHLRRDFPEQASVAKHIFFRKTSHPTPVVEV